MRSDGSNAVRVTSDPHFETSPAWSPDGTQIAFVSDRTGSHQIFTTASDGSQRLRQFTGDGNNDFPSWSPDGSKIAFVSDRTGNEDIFTMRAADGGGETDLTRNSSAPDRYPAWSPDGTKIVFRSSRAHSFAIYLMNADGSNVVKLTSALGREIEPGFEGFSIAFGKGAPGTSGSGGAGGGASGGRPAFPFRLKAPKRQHVIRQKGLVFFIRCDVACPIKPSAVLSVRGSRKTLTLKGTSRRLAAGRNARVKLVFTRKILRRVGGLLSRGRVTAKLAVVAGEANVASTRKAKVTCLR
jgi:WD40 repeat protein